MQFFDKCYYALLLAGAVIGLVCVLFGLYLVVKRMRGAVELEIKYIGKVKTTLPGLSILVIGVGLFSFSMSTYRQTNKLTNAVAQLTATNKKVKILSHAIEKKSYENIAVAGRVEHEKVSEGKDKWVIKLDGKQNIAGSKVEAIEILSVPEKIDKFKNQNVRIDGSIIKLENQATILVPFNKGIVRN